MGGLFVATFLTLLFLPALYALWFRKKLKADDLRAKAPPAESTAPVALSSPPALATAAE